MLTHRTHCAWLCSTLVQRCSQLWWIQTSGATGFFILCNGSFANQPYYIGQCTTCTSMPGHGTTLLMWNLTSGGAAGEGGVIVPSHCTNQSSECECENVWVCLQLERSHTSIISAGVFMWSLTCCAAVSELLDSHCLFRALSHTHIHYVNTLKHADVQVRWM